MNQNEGEREEKVNDEDIEIHREKSKKTIACSIMSSSFLFFFDDDCDKWVCPIRK